LGPKKASRGLALYCKCSRFGDAAKAADLNAAARAADLKSMKRLAVFPSLLSWLQLSEGDLHQERSKRRIFFSQTQIVSRSDYSSREFSEILLVISLAHQELLTNLLLVVSGQLNTLLSLLVKTLWPKSYLMFA